MQLNIIKSNNQINLVGRRPKSTILKRRHEDGQEAHEKMFSTDN